MDIMLRFHVHKVAVATDIEKAFLMIAVAPEDRDIPYTQYFSRVLYFADNLSGRIFAFKFSLMAYL